MLLWWNVYTRDLKSLARLKGIAMSKSLGALQDMFNGSQFSILVKLLYKKVTKGQNSQSDILSESEKLLFLHSVVGST